MIGKKIRDIFEGLGMIAVAFAMMGVVAGLIYLIHAGFHFHSK
jgi:hypothetical protein